MAIGTISNVQAFDEHFHIGFMEALAKNIGAINQSQGAIQVSNRFLGGNFVRNAVRRQIANVVTRRDATSVAAVADIPAPETADIGVKVKGKYGPVSMTRDSWHEITGSAGGVEQAGLDYGRDAGEQMISTMIDDALASLVGALDGTTGNFIAATGATFTTTNGVDLIALFGDMARELVAFVMHSKAYFDWVKQQLGANIDGVSNFNVQTASPITLNRAVIVVDSPSLVVTGAPNTYRTLALRRGAAKIDVSRPLDSLIDDVSGLENLAKRVQAEWDYVIQLPGCAFNTAVTNPSLAALATDANWTKVGTTAKDLPGGLVTTN